MRKSFSALSPQLQEKDQATGSGTNVTLPVPPCMSDNSYKRLTNNNPMKPEELEEVCIFLLFLFLAVSYAYYITTKNNLTNMKYKVKENAYFVLILTF